MSRYETSGQSEFQPGSNSLVLANKLGIIDPLEMDLAEADALATMEAWSLTKLDTTFKFSSAYIRYLHRQWLGRIYEFAGEYRTDNVSKSGHMFCASAYIPNEMERFEREILEKHTPCEKMDLARLSTALAATHADLLAIHPFREGNGRLSRWVASLMALQAGFPPLDWSVESEERGRSAYFADLRKGYNLDLTSLEARFQSILKRTVAPPSVGGDPN